MPLGGSIDLVTESGDVGNLEDTVAYTCNAEFPTLATKVLSFRITPPSVPETIRRVVFCTAGGLGADWYSTTFQVAAQAIIDAGLWLVEWKCADGWFGGVLGESFLDCSARGALLFEYLRDNPLEGGGKNFAGYSWRFTGQSGGASLLAYCLTAWGLGDWADVVVMTGGPAFARLDWCCGSEPAEWTAIHPALAPAGVMTCTPQVAMHSAQGILCPVLPAVSAAELRAMSPLYIGADLAYDRARIWIVVGADDCSAASLHGLHFYNQVASTKRQKIVPATPHDVPTTARGIQAIMKALTNPKMGYKNGSW